MMDSEAVAIFVVIADGMEKASEAATISVVEKDSVVADSSSTVALVSEAARGLTAAASAAVKDRTGQAASTVVAQAIVVAVAGPMVVADPTVAGVINPLTPVEI
jgi:hypothetical protein